MFYKFYLFMMSDILLIPYISDEVNKLIDSYLNYAQGLPTKVDLLEIIKKLDKNEIANLMQKRLTFGTAGLRGKMGPGYAAMNELVVIQTSQGLADYLNSITEPIQKTKGVVIGYDNRYNSRWFAEFATLAFLQKYFKVFLFSTITPTPFIPYAVKKLGCLCGIMITASHNPKDDNGYKVYWSNGAQILSPHDKKIQLSIEKNLKPWKESKLTLLAWSSPFVFDPLIDIMNMYYGELVERYISNCDFNCANDLNITYTSLHGVSHNYIKRAFQKLGYNNYFAVEEQMVPDPEFPTVPFPNPEEEHSLDLAFGTASFSCSQLILANDPDVDRLAVAERISQTDETLPASYHVFTGNELGALLGDWLWKTFDPKLKSDPSNCFMISSAVSSKILRSIAAKEGFTFYETLTGFKWMANKAYDCIENGMKFVFAFEEAIGYMCSDMLFDKDGIQAAMQVVHLANFAHNKNRSLVSVLKEVYQKYGYHVSINSYFISHDHNTTNLMFDCLRNYNDEPETYPKMLQDSEDKKIVYKVKGVRDLTTGFDSTQPDLKAILPISSSTQMITFYFDNGSEITLRTSGTEPKIKFYSELIAKVPESEWPAKEWLLKRMVASMIKEWIRPDHFGFHGKMA